MPFVDIDESQAKDVTSQRVLRNRDVNQSGHRPRPLMASSAKGMAKHELRLQREREANEEFSRANEELKKIKKSKSRQNSSQHSGILHSSQSVTEQTENKEDECASKSSQNNSQESAYLTPVTEGMKNQAQDDHEVVFETHTSTPEDNTEEVIPINGTIIQETAKSKGKRVANEIEQIEVMPPTKKQNFGDITDEVQDSGYWDEMDEIDMDWDELDKLDPPVDSISSQPTQQLPNMKESESVFRWANNKNVATSTKATDAASRYRRFIEEEGGESSGSNLNHFTQPKTPLHPTSSSRLIKQQHSVAAAQTHSSTSKAFDRSIIHSQNVSSPTLQRPAFNAASRGGKIQLPHNGARFSTPRKLDPESSQKSIPSFDTPLSRKVMGNTPRLRGTRLPSFKTPFKKGNAEIIANAKQIHSSSPQNRSQHTRPSSQLYRNKVKVEEKQNVARIFDLTNEASSRQKLAEAAALPEWSWKCRESFRSSDDFEIVAQILNNPPSANEFHFTDRSNSDSDAMFGINSARQQLAEAAGCEIDHVPFTWVKNHYSLILWKLAAMAYRCEKFEEQFCWEEVMRQLKYRFEKEINQAHRSALKRIQERDSSSGSSMVLCVYDVSLANDEEEPQIVLTDGWYYIRTRIDGTLSRAVSAGRIKRGRKLAITGARLDAEAAACDPIEGFETSPLMIRANGCKLARWDARLGFQKDPFTASVRSLSAEGGSVSLMDAVAIRVYPKGYTGDSMTHQSDSNQPNPTTSQEFVLPELWNESEEEEHHNKWMEKRKAVTDEIYQNLRSQSKKLMRVTEMLTEACQTLKGEEIINDMNPSQCEDYLNAMIASADPISYLSNLGILPAVLQLAQGRLDILLGEEKDELQRQLEEKCPTRNVRSFQIVRVIDTARYLFENSSIVKNEFGTQQQDQSIKNEKLIRCKRECLIRIWDSDRKTTGLGDIIEGHRYLFSNLSPSRLSSWPKDVDGMDEIHLNTRIETEWKEIPLR